MKLPAVWRAALLIAGLQGAALAQAPGPVAVSPAASSASASAPPPAPPAATQHDDALRLLELWLAAQAAYERLPSLAASAVIGERLVWHGAWGHIDHAGRVPARPDSVYSVCSLSKLFTSIAVMQLWELGKVSLDDDISKFVPGFALQRGGADDGPITVRSLLTHASGLPREGNASYWMGPGPYGFPTRQQLMQALAGQRSFMRPNDHYQYSNLGMVLLGDVVAAASGQPYDTYVQTQVLAPLQLADTKVSLPLNELRLAQGFGALRRDGTRQPLPRFDAQGMTAAFGFSSTVDDLARFLAWQLRLRKNGGTDVLRVSTLREMQRVQWIDPDGDATWGLGFWVDRSTGLVTHSGSCPGHLSAIALLPSENLAVAVASNANGGSMNRYTRGMRLLLAKGHKLAVAPAGGPALADYAGRYDGQPWDSETVIVPWGKGLAMLSMPTSDPAGSMSVLDHVSGDAFRSLRKDKSVDFELSFVRDAAGRINGFVVWNQLSPRLGPLPPTTGAVVMPSRP